MPTLTASPAMKARLEKVAPPPTHQAAQHAAHKPPIAQPKQPPIVQPKQPVLEDPEARRRKTARLERKNALWVRLRELAPALFATVPAPPMAIGTYVALVARLELDAEGARDLGRILATDVDRPGYQKQLAAAGAVRRDLEGNPSSPVTEEQRLIAIEKFERMKAKTKAARDGAGK